jgi:hypothetical protein
MNTQLRETLTANVALKTAKDKTELYKEFNKLADEFNKYKEANEKKHELHDKKIASLQQPALIQVEQRTTKASRRRKSEAEKTLDIICRQLGINRLDVDEKGNITFYFKRARGKLPENLQYLAEHFIGKDGKTLWRK